MARALGWQPRGRGFEPHLLHQQKKLPEWGAFLCYILNQGNKVFRQWQPPDFWNGKILAQREISIDVHHQRIH
jgi:hypothetical protein